MDWSLAHVRRQRKSVFYRLFIYGCARKAYNQKQRHEASGGKTLAGKIEFAALGRFEPSRLKGLPVARAGYWLHGAVWPRRLRNRRRGSRLVVARGCLR